MLGLLPGTDSTGAIAIDAHYDTGATGPGAMDAGSGVVTTLETIRAIVAGPALRNDVIVVFADAEEEGMLGAAAFSQQHQLAEDVRLAINLEGAGGDGPALLLATSQHNNWLVSEFLDAPGEVFAVAVDGRPLDLADRDWARDVEFPTIYRNVPAEGWELTLTVRSPEPVIVTIEETKDGLLDVPGVTIEPRPAEILAAPGYASDPTTVIRTFRFE